MNLFLLSIGGGIGAMARYLLGLSIQKRFPHPTIPVAMLTVNILGSFGLGVFLAATYESFPSNAYEDPLYLLIAVGFFGAFTTFSTFSVETIQLIQQKHYKKASLYFSLSIAGSIVMFLAGYFGGMNL